MNQNMSLLSFAVKATGTELHFCAKLNGEVFFDEDLTTDEIEIAHRFPDSNDTDYTLELILSGKLPEHTSIDVDGNILKDRVVEIKNFSLDEIELTQIFNGKFQYYHDFNGSQNPIVDSFHGIMGCNGTVKFEFSTPVYAWLLENM